MTVQSFDTEDDDCSNGMIPSCSKTVPFQSLSRGSPERSRPAPAVVTPDKSPISPTSSHVASREEVEIPESYVSTIFKGFGQDVDLYRDVLQVSRFAADREIRIAYFRRGREILSEGGFQDWNQAATVGDVSSIVRTRFQAVSMAYEILTTPGWKQYYLNHGLEFEGMEDDEEDYRGCGDG